MHTRRFLTSALVCALPFALAACDDKAPPDPRTQTPLVRAATVQAAGPASRSFTGTVAARVQSDLGFRVSEKCWSAWSTQARRSSAGSCSCASTRST